MGASPTLLSSDEAQALRDTQYNATVTHLSKPHDRLMRLRVRLDPEAIADQPFHYLPGQYTTIGLGYWESRLAEAQPEEINDKTVRRLAKRAYSISCRVFDDQGNIVQAGSEQELEFYIALVTEAPKPPALTPRLFLVEQGGRLFVGPRAKGTFTLDQVQADDNLVFAGTGTGEAPHNAMVTQLLAQGHRGKIAHMTCVRYAADLAYLEEHRKLEELYPNYRYIALTTREPENRDANHPEYTGLRYVQDYLASDRIEEQLGFALAPSSTKVYLCGNPSMIGIPHKEGDPRGRYPEPRGVIEVLEGLGFQIDEPKQPGNIHFEKYW